MKVEKISEMDDALGLKRNDVCLHLTILVSSNSKVFKSHDKKERELVVRRVAYEDQVAELTD